MRHPRPQQGLWRLTPRIPRVTIHDHGRPTRHGADVDSGVICPRHDVPQARPRGFAVADSAALRFEPTCYSSYSVIAEDRWMPSPVTAEGSGRDREIPVPDIPRR